MPTRLPEDAVLFIRRYHRAGYRVTTIAGALGVSRKAVFGVVNGRTHKTVLDSDLPPLRPVKVDCEPILADGRTGAHIPETAPPRGSIAWWSLSSRPRLSPSSRRGTASWTRLDRGPGHALETNPPLGHVGRSDTKAGQLRSWPSHRGGRPLTITPLIPNQGPLLGTPPCTPSRTDF